MGLFRVEVKLGSSKKRKFNEFKILATIILK